MKAIIVFLSFLLFSFSTRSFFRSAAGEPEAVRDIYGDKLLVGEEYYVLPVMRGMGGGLTVSSFDREKCPLSVVQARNEVERGLPLTFTPANPGRGIVPVSTDLNVRFCAETACAESNVWNVDYDVSTGKYVIFTDGVEGNPGPQTIDNWFKIEKYQLDYKLVFCPTVCDYCQILCKDVGIFFQDGMRRLALTDDRPLGVMFARV